MTPETALSHRRLCEECGAAYTLREYGEGGVATAHAIATGGTCDRESVLRVNYIILAKCPSCYSLFLLKGMENFVGEGEAKPVLEGKNLKFGLTCLSLGLLAALMSGLALRLIATVVALISASSAGSFLFLLAQSGLSFFLYLRLLRWRGIEWNVYRELGWTRSTWPKRVSLSTGWCLALFGGIVFGIYLLSTQGS